MKCGHGVQGDLRVGHLARTRLTPELMDRLDAVARSVVPSDVADSAIGVHPESSPSAVFPSAMNGPASPGKQNPKASNQHNVKIEEPS
jgi:hypothetical protein